MTDTVCGGCVVVLSMCLRYMTMLNGNQGDYARNCVDPIIGVCFCHCADQDERFLHFN